MGKLMLVAAWLAGVELLAVAAEPKAEARAERSEHELPWQPFTTRAEFEKLGTGFLFTEGLIRSLEDISVARYCEGDGLTQALAAIEGLQREVECSTQPYRRGLGDAAACLDDFKPTHFPHGF